MLSINEIFFSIQGESTYAGRPCIFIRLAFCNLRCSWCDTEYAFYESQKMSFDEIMDAVQRYPCKLVEITGGEPLAQNAILPFMTHLCDKGYKALLETSGSIDIARVDPRVKTIMDIKCPGSGMSSKNRLENFSLLKPQDEVKFVIKDRLDYEWAKNLLNQYCLPDKCVVLMAPVFGELLPRDLADWILDDGLDVCYQLQLHKYIWDPKKRGV